LRPYPAFVSSDLLIDACVHNAKAAARLLKLEMDKLDTGKGEKLAISHFALNDVIVEALRTGLDLRAIIERLVPGYSQYFWILLEDDKTIDNAKTCVINYPKIRLSLSDWIALHLMSKHGITVILSNNREIDKAIMEPNLRGLFGNFHRIQA
jgi:predicted nucleic acid-binding protein